MFMPSSMTWMWPSPSLSGRPTSATDRLKLDTWTDTGMSVLVTVSPALVVNSESFEAYQRLIVILSEASLRAQSNGSATHPRATRSGSFDFAQDDIYLNEGLELTGRCTKAVSDVRG